MKTLVSTAVNAVMCGGLATMVTAGYIDPTLEKMFEESTPGQIHSALVYLEYQADVEGLKADFDAVREKLAIRHEEIVLSLQQTADLTQGPVLDFIDDLQNQNEVTLVQPYWIVNAMRVDGTEAALRAIADHEDVDIVYFNFPIENITPENAGKIQSPPNRGGGGVRTPETGVVVVRAPEVWAMGYTGTGVIVSTLDTGVDGSHPALDSRWKGRDPEYAGHPEWAFFDPVTGWTEPQDSGSHGTHTMGTVCGGAPGDEVGVAPGAKWIHAAVIDRVSIPQTVADAILAFQWTADPDGNPGTYWDVPATSSNSWGLATAHGYPECDETFWTYIDNMEAVGVVAIFSAGNEGFSGLRRPADRATDDYRSMAVGGIQEDSPTYEAYTSSSRGPTYCTPGGTMAIKPEIAAPAVNTRSSIPGGGYGEKTGTSMASPHVNGVVALMREACPDLTPDEIKQIIYDTALDLGSPGKDNTYGYGLIDAVEAVLEAEALCGPSPPRAYDASYQTGVDVPLNITLVAQDHDGQPGGPLQYKITVLPAAGNTVTDMGNGHVILPGELPYTLVNDGNQVTYTPTGGYYGNDEFHFVADDGGTPPEGGDSEPATISILVQFGPPVITTSSLPDGYLGYSYGPVQIEVDQGQPPLTHMLITDEYAEADLGSSMFAETGVDQNWNADDNSWAYALPFTFTFYENDYTSCWVSSNGYIDFASSISDYSNSDQELIENVRIAPLWDDWETDCGSGGDIYIDESVPGEVTIRWKAQRFPCSAEGDFSVTLIVDGTIRFHYGSTNGDLSPTIGISSGDGSNYLFSMYNNSGSLPSANSVEFYPPLPLPEGMTFSPSGVLGGIPTEMGTFEPRFRVIDALDRTDTRQLELVITDGVPPCPADLTGDYQVNIEDVFEALGLWGACPDPCPPYCRGDLTEDCTVDIDDIFAIIGLWGPCE